MSVLAFFENERREIRKVVNYANHNIYQLDDILDMMNNEKITPSEIPEHLVLVGMGRWICYFLVDHPNKGRCHYFQIKPDIRGVLPDKAELEYIVKEFGIENPLLDKHITTDEKKKWLISFFLLTIENRSHEKNNSRRCWCFSPPQSLLSYSFRADVWVSNSYY